MEEKLGKRRSAMHCMPMLHEKITQVVFDATIDTVYVYDKKRIEVVFKFDDILMRAIEKYQKGKKKHDI